MFKLSNKNAIGTSMHGATKRIRCLDLIETFGLPNTPSDEHKVSHEWNFESSDGKVFTLYDYKATNLYDPDHPSPEEFRNDPNGYNWHVGCKNQKDADVFIYWVYEQLM